MPDGIWKAPSPGDKIEELRFSENKEVNGVEIMVDWIDGIGEGYEMCFPQINAEIKEKTGAKEVVPLTKDPEFAKSVFDFAEKQAETYGKADVVSEKVCKFVGDILYRERRKAAELPENIDKSYSDKTKVNDIDIIVNWDNDADGYIIYLPQLKLDEDIREKEGYDVEPLIFINNKRHFAQGVYEFVVEEAKKEPDIYELCRKTKKFIDDLNALKKREDEEHGYYE